MVAHPNRNKGNRSSKQSPLPEEVRRAREVSGLTQKQAGAVIYGTEKGWQNYEAKLGTGESRPMHPGLFELFLLKTGQLDLAELLDRIAAEAWNVSEGSET